MAGRIRVGLAGRLCHWALMLVVTFFILEELGIVPHTDRAAFKIGLGSLDLPAALALGLGNREAADRFWLSIQEKPPQER